MLGMAGLLLPAGYGTLTAAAVHTVRKGDTLSGLAVRYGVTVGDIKRSNALTSDLIRIGQKLKIPDAASDLVDIEKLLSGLRIDQSRWK